MLFNLIKRKKTFQDEKTKKDITYFQLFLTTSDNVEIPIKPIYKTDKGVLMQLADEINISINEKEEKARKQANVASTNLNTTSKF